MDINKLKSQLAAMQEEINRTAEQYGLGGHLQHMLNGGEIHELPVAPYGYAAEGTKNDGKKYHAFNSANYNRPTATSSQMFQHAQNRPGTPAINPMLQHQVSDVYNLMQFNPDREIQGTNLSFTPEADLVRQINGAPVSKKLNNSVSIVDTMKAMGDDSSFANRKKIAQEMGIKNYTGNADQNKQLLAHYIESKSKSVIQPVASIVPTVSNRPAPQVPTYPQVSNQQMQMPSYSFDELPANTGGMMMNDRAIGSAMPTSQPLPPTQNMDMGEYNQQYGPYKMGGVAGQMGDMYYAGGNIPSHPEIMHLYGFEEGGQIMELPVAPYGYNEEGGRDTTEGMTKGSAMSSGLSSAQIANLATHYFSQDPSMSSGVPAMIGERRLSDNERMLIQEGMKQLSNAYKQGKMAPLSPGAIDQLRSTVAPLKQSMGGMNYEDGGQLPMDIAVARFKAAAKDKGLSGGEAMAYVEKMKSKYNYQAGGAVKESDVSQYDLAQYGNGGIMFDGNKFPGYNKPIATPPGDKHRKMMILKKGGKVKLVKFGHR